MNERTRRLLDELTAERYSTPPVRSDRPPPEHPAITALRRAILAQLPEDEPE